VVTSDPDTPRHPDTPAETHAETHAETVRHRGPTLSLAEAITASGLSRSTLQRRLKAGDLEGATRTRSGGWAIPIRALIGAGLMPATSPPDTPQPTASVTDTVPELHAEHERLRVAYEQLRAELEHERRLAAVRDEHLNDLRRALEAMSRALPAGPADTPAERRHWWNRKR
jgi:hypothetical protein